MMGGDRAVCLPGPAELAALHARGFAGRGRGWSAAEFATLLADAQVVAVGDGRAFALGRAVVDEAELLTIVTDPDHRRQGLAAAVLSAFEGAARDRGAARVLLEVAQGNAAAAALYAAAGYAVIGRRAGYYRSPDGGCEDALILERGLA